MIKTLEMVLPLRFSHTPFSNKNNPHSLSPQLHLLSPNSLTLASFRAIPHLPSCHRRPLSASAQSVVVDENDVVNGRVSDAVVSIEEEDVVVLPAGLSRQLMPEHVAVIMDGNRRWARMRGLPVWSGYEAGLRALRMLVGLCCRLGIRVLTVFAFSSDNWFRPKMEIDFLMSLFEKGLNDELDNFVKDHIRISVIGDTSKLPKSLQKLIANAEDTTKHHSQLQLIVAVSYSGKYDIVQACQSIALKVKDGLIEPKDINEFLIDQELETNCTNIPCPDLLIRTSGELRVSNFFLWQLAYAELFFVESHWPDFGEDEFLEALRSFQQRQRRFGRRGA